MNLRSTLQTKMRVCCSLGAFIEATPLFTHQVQVAQAACFQGKEPWNKGRQMSQETRERMRAAKLGTRHSSGTRARMSASHMGLPQSQVCLPAAASLAQL